jgi:ribosomal protein L11 methyltransferase
MPWIALTLQVDAGAAEAMSDALVEAGAQSVAIDGVEREHPTLQALVAIGEDADRLVGGAAKAAGLAATPRFTTSEVADEDWVRRTQAQFAPIEVGARLWVGPTHPTTLSVLTFLESQIRGGEKVLDYGCGSGILAIAAAKLGAARIDAVDIDPQAVQTALANARVNRVELRAALPEALAPAVYDIVVSNILAQPLIVLAPLLAARSARGGRLALAGILDSQAAEVAAAYSPWFELRTEQPGQGWALLTGLRR